MVPAVFALAALVGCAQSPPKSDTQLIISPGLRQIFAENPEIESIEDGATYQGVTIKCRYESRLGSHIGARVCMTHQEWQEREDTANRIARQELLFRQ